MRKKILAFFMLTLILVGMYAITYRVALRIKPVVFAGPSSSYREVWKIVNVTNAVNWPICGDINVTVTPSDGVNIAWSTNITEYFENIAYWKSLEYNTYMEWLNGTSGLAYHWEEMDWYVSEGSLTPITWDKIKHWWEMYRDTGGGVSYETFMGNTYMADCNETKTDDDPDIIYPAIQWDGSTITIKELVVPEKKKIHLVLKIVITEPSAYAFNLTSLDPDLEISPSSWRVGGVATLVVGKGPAYEYNTIQEAIGNATTGDTIIVYEGTYMEQISITKSLRLRGVGAGATIIRAPASMTTVSVRGGTQLIQGVVNVVGATAHGIAVDISGFTVNGSYTVPGSSSTWFAGIVYSNADGSIEDNTITEVRQETLVDGSASWRGHGIWIGDASKVTVNNNTISDYQRNGVEVRDAEATATVTSNTVTGLESAYTVANGITFYGATNGTISGNTVTDCKYTGTGSGNDFYGGTQAAGILVYEASGNFSITNNTARNNDMGIYSRLSSAADITDNIAKDNLYFGIVFRMGDVIATGNNITGSEIGILVPSTRPASSSAPAANFNNIYSNTVYGLKNDASYSTDASHNWWGNETGPYNSTLNPNGNGDGVSDNVEFKPWLIQPYPPAIPVSELYVDPGLVQCWSGLNKTFEVKVKLDNVMELFGFEFKLKWDHTKLNVTYVDYRELWGAETEVWQDIIDNTIGQYWLALTGKGDADPFTGGETLATLTFRIVDEPVYPDSVTSGLNLTDTLLSRTRDLTVAEPILHVVYNGTYMCNYTLPQMVVGQYVIERTPYTALGTLKEFYVNVSIINVINLEAFYFNFTYDPDLLKVTDIEVPEAIAGLDNSDADVTELGCLFVSAWEISPLVNGTATLAKIRFRVLWTYNLVWNTVNRSVSCDLGFIYTNLTGPGDTLLEHDAINGTYLYKPVPGDLDMSGKVDILDLSAAAHAFGLTSSDPGWKIYWLANVYVDDAPEQRINILDIVIIARNFHRTEPEP